MGEQQLFIMFFLGVPIAIVIAAVFYNVFKKPKLTCNGCGREYSAQIRMTARPSRALPKPTYIEKSPDGISRSQQNTLVDYKCPWCGYAN